MRTVGVIPARFASTRLPGKVLADIHGKPMIRHIWERAKRSARLDEVLIACDDARVKEAAEDFGAAAVMTPPELSSGTDRIACAVKGVEADIVINIQGDEPLIRSEILDDLARALAERPGEVMATVVTVLKDEEGWRDPNVVKAVLDKNGRALYFSRAPVPYDRDGRGFQTVRVYKHLGLYAYTKDFLLGFKDLPPSQLEEAERLEQLRVLEAGFSIVTVQTPYDTVAVDTQSDLDRVRQMMKEGEHEG